MRAYPMLRRRGSALADDEFAACALWMRSYWRCDELFWNSGLGESYAFSQNGQLYAVWWPVYRPSRLEWAASAPATQATWRDLAWAARIGSDPGAPTRHFVGTPHALPARLATALPVWWLIRHRSRQPSDHLFRSCGYDLRGSEGTACPQCGEERMDRATARPEGT